MSATKGDALRSHSSWGEGGEAGFRRRASGIPPYPAIPVRNPATASMSDDEQLHGDF